LLDSALVSDAVRTKGAGGADTAEGPTVKDLPGFADVEIASARIAAHIHDTPIMTCRWIDDIVGSRVHFKCEHLQRSGAFKFRGAANAVFALDDQTAARGVAAHSSGNHAAALALAARTRGIRCSVVMPGDAPAAKQRAAEGYGAEIVLCAPTLAARETTLADVLARTGATEIHPYDHPHVIAGQATATRDLLVARPEIGAVIAPVSGGGLLSGAAIAANGAASGIVVYGAEPSNVDDAYRSLLGRTRTSEGNTTSIADGLLAVLSDRTFRILQAAGVEVVTVTETEITDAMALVFSRMKQVIEPSAATAVAGLVALAQRGAPLPEDVGVILSGGNVDLDRLPFITRIDP